MVIKKIVSLVLIIMNSEYDLLHFKKDFLLKLV